MSDLGQALMLLAVGQGAVLAVVLSRRANNRLANRILAALVAAVSLMLLLGFLDLRWGWHGHPNLIALGAPLPYLFAPLQWLYVVALTRPLTRLEPRQLVHAVPFLADLLFMLLAFYFQSPERKLALATDALAGHGSLSLRIMDGVQVVQAVAYLSASFVVLRRYRGRIEGYFSDLHRIDLRWLTILVGAHAAVWSLVLVNFAIHLAAPALAAEEGLRSAIMIGSTLFVFLIGYISLWQKDLLQQSRDARRVDREAEPEPGPSPESELAPTDSAADPARPESPATAGAGAPRPARYRRNRLEEAEATELVHELEALMAERELYRDGGLTSQVLADALGITPHLLSQLLNVHVGKSFYAFVNGYRAEALKAALADPAERHRGVLELALAVGFNSKSTVNSAFKKHTGLTPSQFRSRQPQPSM